jgi:hypothetical protein
MRRLGQAAGVDRYDRRFRRCLKHQIKDDDAFPLETRDDRQGSAEFADRVVYNSPGGRNRVARAQLSTFPMTIMSTG